MFDGLQGKLQEVFRSLKGEGKITEETLDGALREIRLALLEADVNYRVVKSFVARVRERAIDEEVLASLTPTQQVVKIVRDELAALLGEEGEELRVDGTPAVVLLCGLQGSGKTTTAGKLGRRLERRGHRPVLVAGDLQRAAAVDQLVQVGERVDLPVLEPRSGETPLELARRARGAAREGGQDVLVFDTAGRLHVDERLMEEIRDLAAELEPAELLFIADAMTGQDAVKSAGTFADELPLSGIVLTKLDGDTRGGAALSVRTVTDAPIRFVGVGENPEDLERFHPERMASRIIGMGDVLTLIERAERQMDVDEAERLAEKMASDEFTLEDLRDQLRQLRRLGPLSQILEMMPKRGPLGGLDDVSVDESQIDRIEAIINSMTPLERRHPKVLNGSRRKRIAAGSGTKVREVNQLIKRYRQMRKMMGGMQGRWLRRALGGR